MNEYTVGQTVYYIQFIANIPSVVEFLIVAIRQTASGYTYSKFLDPASTYKTESELFATITDAVNYQITVLQALIP